MLLLYIVPIIYECQYLLKLHLLWFLGLSKALSYEIFRYHTKSKILYVFIGLERQPVVEQMANMMGVKAFKLGESYGWNKCVDNNGGCSHLCFNTPKNYVCSCPLGMNRFFNIKSINITVLINWRATTVLFSRHFLSSTYIM